MNIEVNISLWDKWSKRNYHGIIGTHLAQLVRVASYEVEARSWLNIGRLKRDHAIQHGDHHYCVHIVVI